MAHIPNNDNSTQLLQRVINAQKDKWVREQLIEDYIPYILKIVSRHLGKFVTIGHDDEVSVGMMAFNEAISCFASERSSSFLSLAETIIRRRLIDFQRSQGSKEREIPLSSYLVVDDANTQIVNFELRAASKAYSQQELQAERMEEIQRYSSQLSRFKISFHQLVDLSPKHEDAKMRAREVAEIVAKDAKHWNHLCQRGELRLQELEKLVSVSRKTLERHRKYIIAIAVVLAGDYPQLASYITNGGARKEGETTVV